MQTTKQLRPCKPIFLFWKSTFFIKIAPMQNRARHRTLRPCEPAFLILKSTFYNIFINIGPHAKSCASPSVCVQKVTTYKPQTISSLQTQFSLLKIGMFINIAPMQNRVNETPATRKVCVDKMQLRRWRQPEKVSVGKMRRWRQPEKCV